MKPFNNNKNPIVPDIFNFESKKIKKSKIKNIPKTLFNHPEFELNNKKKDNNNKFLNKYINESKFWNNFELENIKIKEKKNSKIELENLINKFTINEFISISLLDKFRHKVEKVLHLPTFNIFFKESIQITDKGNKSFKINKKKLIDISKFKYYSKIYSIFQYKKKVEIISEPMLGGNLFYLIEKAGALSLKIIKVILLNILKGLDQLHKFDNSYNELNLKNILFSRSGKIKLNSPINSILNNSSPINDKKKDFYSILFVIISCLIGEEIVLNELNLKKVESILFENDNLFEISNKKKNFFNFENEENEILTFFKYKYKRMNDNLKNFLKIFFNKNLTIAKILDEDFLKIENYNDYENDIELFELLNIFNFVGDTNKNDNETRRASKFSYNSLEKLCFNISKKLDEENIKKWFNESNYFFINNIIFINENTNFVKEWSFYFAINTKIILKKINEFIIRNDFIKDFKNKIKNKRHN